MRRCTVCRELKPVEAYGAYARGRDGLRPACKACHADAQRDYRSRRPAHEFTLERLYGITPAQYDAMLESQGGGCALCGKKQTRRLAVDHDHETGEVRGILCTRCNVAIAALGDSVEGVERALNYLKEARNAANPV